MESKRAALIGTCLIILVAGIVGSFIFVLHHTKQQYANANDVDGDTTNSERAVERICHSTKYKDTCVKSLSSATNSTDPQELIKVGLHVAVQEISNALQESAFLRNAAKDKKTGEAFKTCEILLDDSIHDLQRTFTRFDSFDLTNLQKLADDLMTWLTGAATYQQTCLDAFENTKEDAGDKMKQLLKVGGELITDALAMVNEISEHLSHAKVSGLNRRLLWETDEGTARRLLHAANATPQTVQPNVTVAQDGSGKYQSINEALKEVPIKATAPFIIYIKEGIYAEYVTIMKEMWNVMLIGDGPTKTKITGNKSFVGGLGTFLTATVVVEGDHFIGKDIGIENTAGPEMHQAVALRVTADESIFHNCQLDGYQDTLYAHNHRQFYRDCTISGTIDFIFGNARAILQNCTLIVRKPLVEQKLCMVTAQGRFEEDQMSAIILQNCKIIPDAGYPTQDPSYRAYLGRPWKLFSRTIVMDSDIDAIINPDGWARWLDDQNIATCWYTEIGNKGAGADQTKRVTWPGIKKITEEDAVQFTAGNFFSGDEWIKNAGIPYEPGRMSP
ncbi:hypothetical protein ACH5RR_033503 [Cinchona calisaya]|uniref:Pectinesterase n=1 Tax=Cinchona calisaya TaxID=153742 RepID=A0ABD2YN70_9GENT